ncbi:nuclease-related domain-containing protein [Bacillus sp. AFS031507]|uniref:nuclease-related domain-containing protein n=1 Tax=Bacillus sp. AFS031507 TaxID=2033496 RepID=UPI000BFD9C2D|nr:nuclease-related domain-containing protein [Bacillus sp. AFS031507]PGY10020.1 nuclease [Bacillus sp. AFS031507]
MAYKPRVETGELLILRILNKRMNLTTEEQLHYKNKEKGFEGEVEFDLLTEKLQCECFILNDLLLEVNNSKFQIDTTIIFQETIYPCEIKNYEGDFIFKPDRLERISGKDYKNPLDQFKRTKFMLRQLLQNLGYNIPIEGTVVFINPEFTLYQAPLNEPIVYHSQLNRFMKKLDMQPSKLTSRHKKLADKFVSLHQIESPYRRLPPYKYTQMRKGMTCITCNSFKITVPTGARKVICDDCGCEEGFESAVLRNVEEIKLLFPDKKITTNLVFEWCGVVGSKKTIKKFLMKNYRSNGKKKYTYYI